MSTVYILQTRDEQRTCAKFEDAGEYDNALRACAEARQMRDNYVGIATRVVERRTVEEVWQYWEAQW